MDSLPSIPNKNLVSYNPSLIMLYCFIRYNKSKSLEIRRSYFLSIMARAGRVMMIAERITELKDLQREFANLLLSI